MDLLLISGTISSTIFHVRVDDSRNTLPVPDSELTLTLTSTLTPILTLTLTRTLSLCLFGLFGLFDLFGLFHWISQRLNGKASGEPKAWSSICY